MAGKILPRVTPRFPAGTSTHEDKESLFTRKDIGHVFAPQQTQYLPDGTVLLTAVEKRSYRVGKLSLGQ